MNKKPIKRNEHIILLSRDHHFSLLFGWKIRQGLKKKVALERIADYVAYFWKHNLQAHFKEEEATLFAVVEDELVGKALADHQIISSEVAAIARCKPGELQEMQLEKLAKLVDAHVRLEEREVFPHLEKKLSAQQLATIGSQLQKMHRDNSLLDDYEDEFWVTGSV